MRAYHNEYKGGGGNPKKASRSGPSRQADRYLKINTDIALFKVRLNFYGSQFLTFGGHRSTGLEWFTVEKGSYLS